MAVTIREATAEDAPFLAQVIQLAARSHLPRGFFDIALNRPEQQCLDFLCHLAVVPTRSFWHYSLFIVAEVDGQPAAALCGFKAGDVYPLSGAAMTEAARALSMNDSEIGAMWQRGGVVFTALPKTDAQAWTIENVATLPGFRRRGLTRLLLEEILVRGKKTGLVTAQITFLIGNAPAEEAYKVAGFRFADEARHPDFEAAVGCPGLRRMTRGL